MRSWKLVYKMNELSDLVKPRRKQLALTQEEFAERPYEKLTPGSDTRFVNILIG